METEIEAKWIVQDLNSVRERLRAAGAELMHPERLMRRKPYDFPDDRLGKRGGWVRVRDEGDRTTFTYKELRDRTLEGTLEETVTVDDFERTCSILESIGLEAKSYQETKRETWRMGGCEVTLDTWPWIPPVVEIEAPAEALVRGAAADLGFDWSGALHGSIENVYTKYYDATEEEVCHWDEIVFSPVPPWLEAKRRK